jgi:hypothetical protein
MPDGKIYDKSVSFRSYLGSGSLLMKQPIHDNRASTAICFEVVTRLSKPGKLAMNPGICALFSPYRATLHQK